ncbi:MAG: SpoIIE family protein phosphatase [Acidobacteriia bacterium]|nr:SpoIIE family protein phosphatase [Terriglobia bacterium]
MRDDPAREKTGFGLYLCLAIVFALALLAQVTFTVDVVRDLANDYPRIPISLGRPWPTITEITPSASDAGLRKGDRVVTIDGFAPSGLKGLPTLIRSKKPGDALTIVVERAGEVSEHRVILKPIGQEGSHLALLYAVVVWIALPWFCLTVGFWVAAVRICDARAWMVMGILVGMSQLAHSNLLDPLGWGSWGVVTEAFSEISSYLWALCMMLFGMYFPDRWRFDQRWPWVKWTLTASTAALMIWSSITTIGYGVAFAATDNLLGSVTLPDSISFVVLMVVMSFFFIGLRDKYRDASQPPDARRRLRVLYFGCSLAMSPMFVLFIIDAVVFRRSPGNTGGTLLGLALAFMFLFPVTLAYVIVVQRALDVRVVIRQGVQYALARGGIRIITACLIIAIIIISISLMEGPHVSRMQKVGFLGFSIVLVLRLRDLAERLRRWVDRKFFREAYDAERILGDLSEQVRTILDKNALMETVTRKLAESLHVERILVMLQDGLIFRPAYSAGYDVLPEIALPSDAATVVEMQRTREPVAVDGRKGDQSVRELQQLGTKLLLPLATKKELLGFISLGPKKSEEPYSTGDRNLLRTVAAQTGLALENSRLSEAIAAEVTQRELLNREIEIAREVQERLFPQNLPAVAALEYSGHCRPARGVGGDYYDFLPLPGGRLGLVIGDVSGKGVPAALLMASLQASVRGQSQAVRLDGHPDLAGLMENVNRLVFDASPANRYATFFYAQFEPTRRRLTYTNGGHNAPMLLRDERLIRLETGGPPVGLFAASRYEQGEIELMTGDLLVLYTDGVSEAENPQEAEWGEEALLATVRSCSRLPPSEIIGHVLDTADKFAAGAPQHDDMTLVVARVLPA